MCLDIPVSCAESVYLRAVDKQRILILKMYFKEHTVLYGGYYT